MSAVRMMKNTDKEYPCTNCGSINSNIVREGANPRLKCSDCNFMFNGSDSLAAKEAGAIPDGPPEIQEPFIPEPPVEAERSSADVPTVNGGTGTGEASIKVPRTPSHVFIAKRRDKVEFCTKKDLKRVAVKWQYENIPHDVFELLPKTIRAKVEIE